MSNNIHFKAVGNERELSDVFRLRYRVFGEEFGYISAGKEFDLYDRVATNFLAYGEGETVGTIRIINEPDLEKLSGNPDIVRDGRVRFPIEKEVDLSEYRNGEGNIVEVSRLVILPQFRHTGVSMGLFACIYHFTERYDIDDLFIIANCEMDSRDQEDLNDKERVKIPDLYTKIGFKSLTEPFFYRDFDAWAVPMHMEARTLPGQYKQIFEKLKDRIEF